MKFNIVAKPDKLAKFERVYTLYSQLLDDEPISEEEIIPYAENAVTREMTYELLVEFGKEHLFPKQFYTIIKAAESNLIKMLETNSDFKAVPDKIEYIKRVTFEEDEAIHYEVFNYSYNEPHFAASRGFMIGVVGPYFNDSHPFDDPFATFSSMLFSSDDADEEAAFVHKSISVEGVSYR